MGCICKVTRPEFGNENLAVLSMKGLLVKMKFHLAGKNNEQLRIEMDIADQIVTGMIVSAVIDLKRIVGIKTMGKTSQVSQCSQNSSRHTGLSIF